MTNSINQNSIGFFAKGGLTLARDAEEYTKVKYDKNITERLGDVLLWPIVELPCHIKNVATKPQVVVVALTAIALLSVVFMFHNNSARELAKLALKTMPTHSTHAKLTAEAATITAIMGWGIRAYGRLTNSELMDAWRQKNPEQT